MRISDWSSDVCSSDLRSGTGKRSAAPGSGPRARKTSAAGRRRRIGAGVGGSAAKGKARRHLLQDEPRATDAERGPTATFSTGSSRIRSEEQTSELQSLMRISYAVFGLKKKNNKQTNQQTTA